MLLLGLWLRPVSSITQSKSVIACRLRQKSKKEQLVFYFTKRCASACQAVSSARLSAGLSSWPLACLSRNKKAGTKSAYGPNLFVSASLGSTSNSNKLRKVSGPVVLARFLFEQCAPLAALKVALSLYINRVKATKFVNISALRGDA